MANHLSIQDNNKKKLQGEPNKQQDQKFATQLIFLKPIHNGCKVNNYSQ